MSNTYLTTDKLYPIWQSCSSVSTDSRNVACGSMFFALKGGSFNGNLFAADALEKGAAWVVVDDISVVNDDRYLLVEDTLTALQELAAFHRKQITATVIAITGSNGKTTTKELIQTVLSSKYSVVATAGNLNNHIGVPLTLLRATTDTQMLIVEMGANHPGEIADLCNIAEPDAGIITNIGVAHLEGFGSPEGVKKAKSELYHYILQHQGTYAFWNADDPVIAVLVKDMGVCGTSYGASTDAVIRGVPEEAGLQLALSWCSESGLQPVKTHLVGGYNFPNVMAAIAVGSRFHVPDGDIVRALEQYVPANNRSQYIETPRNRIIVDCYNANPSSMKASVSHFISTRSPEPLLILGDMFELGEYAGEEHVQLLRWVLEQGIPVILVGEVFSSLAGAYGCRAFANVTDMIPWLLKEPLEGRSILLKGSRGVRIEQLLPYL